MTKVSELIGRETMALGSATKAGTITGIALDKNRISVAQAPQPIASSAVRNFDGDVLTFDEQVLSPASGDPVTSDPRGTSVLDQHGNGLGFIVDMTISTDGLVESILLSTGETLAGSRLVSLGSYAAIISLDL